MYPVLGITTATGPAVAVVTRDGSWRAASTDGRAHAELLDPLIEETLGRAGIGVKDLRAVAVGTGPAPYTGMRIGLMAAKTLGFALGIPVWGVGDLDALATAAAQRQGLDVGQEIVATLDAKRRELYWARYVVVAPGEVELQEGPEVSAIDAVPSGGLRVGPNEPVDPACLARLALSRAQWGAEQGGQEQAAVPNYLRRPDIAAPAPRKRATLPAQAQAQRQGHGPATRTTGERRTRGKQ
jgi:tRNA threonylcarbamoyladenosine biosynthesis protein TsaB